MTQCVAPYCTRDAYARSQCRTHYAAQLERERAADAAAWLRMLAAEGREFERDPALGEPGDGCSIAGCPRAHYAFGLCVSHYRAARRREISKAAAAYRDFLAIASSADTGNQSERQTMNDEHEPKGVLEKERDRVAGQSPAEAEAEAFAFACRYAVARDLAPPDRIAHRDAWYSRHGLPVPEQES